MEVRCLRRGTSRWKCDASPEWECTLKQVFGGGFCTDAKEVVSGVMVVVMVGQGEVMSCETLAVEVVVVMM